jgi:hypothetical protein
MVSLATSKFWKGKPVPESRDRSTLRFDDTETSQASAAVGIYMHQHTPNLCVTFD